MSEEVGYKKYFGYDLAVLLAGKIALFHPGFPEADFLDDVRESGIQGLELLARVDLLARTVRRYLPESYPQSLEILLGIYGPENENETGMFTSGYWLWPVARFIELYGLDDFDISIDAIEELTKRHTGEHAVRPYIRAQPDEMAGTMLRWTAAENVHVRRLASEGSRPRLPWSKKLTEYIDEPGPVFLVLDRLKDDRSRFVQKSVGNNLNDYLKENRPEAIRLLRSWKSGATPQRMWIIRHALRRELEKGGEEAADLVRS